MDGYIKPLFFFLNFEEDFHCIYLMHFFAQTLALIKIIKIVFRI